MKRRWLVKIAVLLVLGAIVNVAVAWGLACIVDLADSIQSSAKVRQKGIGDICVMRGEALGSLLVHLEVVPSRETDWQWRDAVAEAKPFTLETLLAQRRPVRWRKHPNGTDEWTGMGTEARGWPCLALWFTHGINVGGTATDISYGIALPARSYAEASSRSSQLTSHRSFGFQQRYPQLVPRVLPLRPIWPVFAINTIFYATVLWLLFAAPFKLRRWRRIKRGLCPACAYPVGASDLCTECGASVQPHGGGGM